MAALVDHFEKLDMPGEKRAMLLNGFVEDILTFHETYWISLESKQPRYLRPDALVDKALQAVVNRLANSGLPNEKRETLLKCLVEAIIQFERIWARDWLFDESSSSYVSNWIVLMLGMALGAVMLLLVLTQTRGVNYSQERFCCKQ